MRTTLHVSTSTRDRLAIIAATRRTGVGELADSVLSTWLAEPEQARILSAVAVVDQEASS